MTPPAFNLTRRFFILTCGVGVRIMTSRSKTTTIQQGGFIMGTRCLTVFMQDEKPLTVLYRQYDGYPTGHGKELADFLSGKKLVNGIPCGADETKMFNGIGCLAASTIAHFKGSCGGFYILHHDERDAGVDYIYFLNGVEGSEPVITVHYPYSKKDIIKCPASEYDAELEKYSKREDDE